MTNFHFTKFRFAESCSISLIMVIKKNDIIESALGGTRSALHHAVYTRRRIADSVHAPRFYGAQNTNPKSQKRNRFFGDQTLNVCAVELHYFRATFIGIVYK